MTRSQMAFIRGVCGRVVMIRSPSDLLHRPRTGRVCGHPVQVKPAGSVPSEHQHVQPLEQHRLDDQEVTGDDGARLGGEERPSSPWIRLWPQAGFSRAIRTTSALTEVPVDGRPGRRAGVVPLAGNEVTVPVSAGAWPG
jgi:hypothetical protein